MVRVKFLVKMYSGFFFFGVVLRRVSAREASV